TLTADLTLYAQWTANTYTVTLNSVFGTINSGDITAYTYGIGATLPTNITREGYTFGGWYDNSELSGDAVTSITTTDTGNKEYWAKWTENTVTMGDNDLAVLSVEGVYDMTYTRSFTAGNWGTICLPFALTDKDKMDAAFGENNYKVTALTGVTNGSLSFTSVTAMEAGKPYLIKFTEAPEDDRLTFNDVEISTTLNPTEVVNGTEVCTMTGTAAVTPIAKNAGNYIIHSNKLYRVTTNNVEIAPFHAYLTYTVGGEARARAMSFFVDGTATGIATIKADGSVSFYDDAWYTLGGKRLSAKPTTRGVYIHNGKKTVIK
ncbi:MAG: InlB B-repeat-containing protein, partial [Prevotella sp.]|nr:InlB B-repeat-containing protein [Prevotella sp.]